MGGALADFCGRRTDVESMFFLPCNNMRNLNLQGNPVTEKNILSKKVKNLVPDLPIFNGKSIKWNNTGKKISKEILGHSKCDLSIPNAFDVEVEKEVKRNKLNRDIKICGTNTSKTPISGVQALPSPAEAEVEKKTRKKKSHKDRDAHAQQPCIACNFLDCDPSCHLKCKHSRLKTRI